MSDSRRRILFACLMALVFTLGWWTGTRLVIEVAPAPVLREEPELEVPDEVVLNGKTIRIAAKSKHQVHWQSAPQSAEQITVVPIGKSEADIIPRMVRDEVLWVGAFVVVDNEPSPVQWIRIIAKTRQADRRNQP